MQRARAAHPDSCSPPCIFVAFGACANGSADGEQRRRALEQLDRGWAIQAQRRAIELRPFLVTMRSSALKGFPDAVATANAVLGCLRDSVALSLSLSWTVAPTGSVRLS